MTYVGQGAKVILKGRECYLSFISHDIDGSTAEFYDHPTHGNYIGRAQVYRNSLLDFTGLSTKNVPTCYVLCSDLQVLDKGQPHRYRDPFVPVVSSHEEFKDELKLILIGNGVHPFDVLRVFDRDVSEGYRTAEKVAREASEEWQAKFIELTEKHLELQRESLTEMRVLL